MLLRGQGPAAMVMTSAGGQDNVLPGSQTFYKRFTSNNTNNFNKNNSRELSIVSFNCEGIVSKQEVIKEIITLTDADLIATQESYLNISSAMTMRYEFKDRELVSRSGDQMIKDKWLRLQYQNKRGVATIVKNDLMKSSKEIDSQCDRVLMQRLELGNQSCLFISIYLPPN